jgi:hypothetical protein
MKRLEWSHAGLGLACIASAIGAFAGLRIAHVDLARAADETAASEGDGSPTEPPSLDRFLPPGAKVTPTPSDEIFPPQSIPLRFDHRLHTKDLGLPCASCHEGARTSDRASDRLLPDPAKTCDGCHDVSHADLLAVRTGGDPSGRCTLCHEGEAAGVEGRVAPVVIPTARLTFSHRAHDARNIGCAHCHGRVEEFGLATREQLPRMAGCFTCHDAPEASRGEADRACGTCHETLPDGRIAGDFSTGALVPPRWLGGAEHTPGWVTQHASIAAADSALCASCHEEQECIACHDGRARPRSVHPNDWLALHAQAARVDQPRCGACHAATTFCADCHRRVGVARDAPPGNREGAGRFHPTPSVWTGTPRGPGHHAWEAQRNLNACVSCHAERDCVTCHAARGVQGGAGVNPHPPGFARGCGGPLRKNPRPCLVCHAPGDAAIEACR